MSSKILIRKSEKTDKSAIEDFINFEFFVHHHVDWKSFSNWIGYSTFQIATEEGEIIACLSIPNESIEVAWIRLFACSSLHAKDTLFKFLFEKIKDVLPESVIIISALGLNQWFINLLKQNSFTQSQNIIILDCHLNEIPNYSFTSNISVSPVDINDLSEILALDKRSFPPIWQVPQTSMLSAFEQAGYFTKAVYNQKIVGYQLCTQSLTSAHLARLAVDPNFQRKNIGSQLVADLQHHYFLSGINHISVNTQDNNLSSQALYLKMGFEITEEKYPVYIYNISR